MKNIALPYLPPFLYMHACKVHVQGNSQNTIITTSFNCVFLFLITVTEPVCNLFIYLTALKHVVIHVQSPSLYAFHIFFTALKYKLIFMYSICFTSVFTCVTITIILYAKKHNQTCFISDSTVHIKHVLFTQVTLNFFFILCLFQEGQQCILGNIGITWLCD